MGERQKLSWNKTNRQGGWLLVILGLLTIIVTLLNSRIAVAWILASTLILTIYLTVYSYFLYKADPNKQTV
jgi:uncharacterized membrane protein